MIQVTPQMRILVAVEAVDFRKGIDSLVQLCRDKLETDPFSGCLCSEAGKEPPLKFWRMTAKASG
jgi:hypothetical protein